MRRGLSVLQRFNGRRQLAWVGLRAAAQHPKALRLGVDDPEAVLNVRLTTTIVQEVLKRNDSNKSMTPGTSQMAALFVLTQLNGYYEGALLKDPALTSNTSFQPSPRVLTHPAVGSSQVEEPGSRVTSRAQHASWLAGMSHLSRCKTQIWIK